jgi:3-oxoadipate enol-lactonase
MTMSVPAYLAQLAVIQNFDTTKELDKLPKIPINVLVGEEDILIPVSLSKKLHKLIPKSTWTEVKGGHGCCLEFPTEFNNAIIEFLIRAESTSSSEEH